MAKRKKKAEPKGGPLPDRLFIHKGWDAGDFHCHESLSSFPFPGTTFPVGEYILIRTGTTRTLLGDLEEEK